MYAAHAHKYPNVCSHLHIDAVLMATYTRTYMGYNLLPS